MPADLNELPAHVYVQRGNWHGAAELFVNASAQGALQRDLGLGIVPGSRVGVYKLERIVQIKVGVQEINQSVQIETSPSEPVTG